MPSTPPASAVRDQAATYGRLFADDWQAMCQPGALEDDTGPVAYLCDLKRQVDLLEEGHTDQAVSLAERRPDLLAMVLDDIAMKRSVSSLRNVTACLEQAVDSTLASGKTVADALANASGTPPFHYAWEQILSTLKHRKWSIWDLVRTSDYDYPNFAFGKTTSLALRQALTMSSQFSPGLRTVLTATAQTTATGPAFLQARYGVRGTTALTDLAALETLSQRTRLDTKKIRQLLTVKAANRAPATGATIDTQSAVTRSAYVTTETGAATSASYGAAYINDGGTPLFLEKARSAVGATRVVGATLPHFDRIHRLLHLREALLRHGMKLSFPDLDLLLVSCFRAEGQTSNFHITPATLRAIGLFVHMESIHHVTPEQFAALIHRISAYANGREISFYDRLFNPDNVPKVAGSTPVLTIDDGTFDPAGTSANDTATVALLCKALRIDPAHLKALLACVATAQSLSKPKRSLAVVSACYRLVALPRLLGLTPQEGLALIGVLNDEDKAYLNQLAGKPSLDTSSEGAAMTADIADVVAGLMNATQWIKSRGLPLMSLCSTLRVSAANVVPLTDWVAAVTTYASRLTVGTTLRTEAHLRRNTDTFLYLSTVAESERIPWVQRLAAFLEPSGVVKSSLSTTALADLKQQMRITLAPVWDKEAQSKADNWYYETYLSEKILSSRDAQLALVKDVVQLGLKLSDNTLVLPLIRWAGFGPADVVNSLLRISVAHGAGETDWSRCFSAEDIRLWHALQRSVSFATLLGTSPAGVSAMVAHPAWFNLDDTVARTTGTTPAAQATMKPLGLTTAYLIDRYRLWLGSLPAGRTEQDALQYLEWVHTSEATTAAAAQSLAALLEWNVADVLDLAGRIPPKTRTGIAEDLRDIDYLMRLKTLSRQNGLSTGALITLNALKSTDEYAAFEQAAPLVAAGMSEQDDIAIRNGHTMAWRDALATWLLVDWVPKAAKRAFIRDEDDLSDYLLTDIRVGPEIETTAVASAIASLQLYVHRLFARLEPGFGNDNVDADSEHWTRYLSQYARWKRYRQLQNHAENTIDPTRRRRKTKAFEELENALGQGKFASANVQTAMLGYLTRFEKVSNIQTLTGYADGTDPLSDMYHFIGKSNVEPAEYFWRTLDMSMRDEDGIPSMLAWSEWEPVTLPVTGEIVQTPIEPAPIGGTPTVAGTPAAVDTDTRSHIDAIRPVIVAGRRYVVWIERDTVGIPMGADSKPSPYFALRVRYAYRQSDGLWSPANTLIALDGHAADGTFPGGDGTVPAKEASGRTAAGNAYLKTRDFQPGVIVMVNASDGRENDPWLTTILFDTGMAAPRTPTRNTDYFLAARDLLLLEEKQLEGPSVDTKAESRLVTNWVTFFRDPRVVQHLYTGAALGLEENASYRHALISRSEGNSSAYHSLQNRPVFFTVRLSADNKKLDIQIKNRDKLKTILGPDTRVRFYAGPSRNSGKALTDDYLEDVAEKISKMLQIKAIDQAAFPRIIAAALTNDDLVRKLRQLANLGLNSSSAPDYKWTPTRSITTKETISKNRKIIYDGLKDVGLTDEQMKYFLSWVIMSITMAEEIVCNMDMQAYTLSDSYTIDSNPSVAITMGVENYTVILEVVADSEADKNDRIARGLCFIRHVSLVDAPDDAVSTVRIRRNAEQVLYLDFTEVNEKASLTTKLSVATLRLNTLFGKRLVAVASDSLDGVLAWETQNLPEPAMVASSVRATMDFRGANGMYFWELFFHVPFIVAWQLSEKGQYADAWRWCTRYLFDPFRRRGGGTDEPPAYWNSVPITFDKGVISLYEMTDDADLYAYESPEHYRKAVFHFLVKHWRREGDQLYRQFTRDSLSEAWLCYHKALKLIGPLPEHLLSTHWTARTLSEVDEEDFVTPWNAQLIETRDLLRHRLYTLRHGLTLDGKIASLPFYAAADDSGLPGPSRAGSSPGRVQGHLRHIPHYRFMDVLPRARDAVRQLIDMGRRLFLAIEAEGNYGLAALKQAHLLELSDFSVILQTDALTLARLERDTLKTSKVAIERRRDYFTALHAEERSRREIAASQIMADVIPLTVAAATAQTVASVVDSFPNIFGMANGGHDLGAVPQALATNLQLAATTVQFIGNEVRVQAEYDRRGDQWLFEADQAQCELDIVEKQLAEKAMLVGTAQVALRAASAQRRTLEAEYTFMTTGFAVADTYAWMVSQMTALYEPAYDAVHSLCRGAEAAYQYETGDFQRSRVRSDAWADGRRGMLAGESLHNDLDRMEADFLTRHERRLHIRKTLSLAALLSPAGDDAARKTVLRASVKPGGDILFGFSQAMFDDDYPGHYLRQVLGVSVSFVLPADSAGRGELSATLTQASNALLVSPKIDGVKRLRSAKEGSEDDIERDLRPRQQVAVSTTRPMLDPETSSSVLCRLMFDDGRYLPFEGTGAVSNWQLHFGGTVDAMKAVFGEGAAGLDDILIHLNYTAADGGAPFAGEVAKLIAAKSNTA